MKITALFITIFALIIMIGCSSDPSTTPELDRSSIVMQAFLYAGEPVTDIRITSTLPLGSEETSAPPINDAVVTLIKNDARYSLVPSPGDSGYYHYSGEDLSILTGDRFKIEVEYSGNIATGETTVPAPPDNVSLTSDTLISPDFQSYGRNNPPNLQNSMLTIKWENNDRQLHFVVVENVESDPTPVEGRSLPNMRNFKFISHPTTNDSNRINFMSLTQLGLHRATVYRVNQEYADLYISRAQDSRDLNEPLTNLTNGLGVFSAFNSDKLYFYFKRE